MTNKIGEIREIMTAFVHKLIELHCNDEQTENLVAFPSVYIKACTLKCKLVDWLIRPAPEMILRQFVIKPNSA